MAVEVFGVTSTTVRQHCFPRLDNFSATTSPTSTTVTAKVDVAGARLAAALAKESITPASIVALGATDPSYVICADIVRKMTALSLYIPTDDPETAKGWQKDVDGFLKQLGEDAGVALANEDLVTEPSEPDGPTHHIDEYGLDIGDTDDASSAEPALRKDDQP